MEIVKKYFESLTEEQSACFERLVPLYREWNEKINVVSRKDIDFLEVDSRQPPTTKCCYTLSKAKEKRGDRGRISRNPVGHTFPGGGVSFGGFHREKSQSGGKHSRGARFAKREGEPSPGGDHERTVRFCRQQGSGGFSRFRRIDARTCPSGWN